MAGPRMGDLASQDNYDLQLAPYGVGSPAEAAGAPSGMGSLAAGLYEGLGGLAKRAFGASEEMRAGGAYNPAPAVETALGTMGGPLVGVPRAAGEVALGSGPIINAYHSSPHDIPLGRGTMDLSKIGTGEGAQVYGHGLYFAENPAVSGRGGQYWNQFLGRSLGHDPVNHRAMQYLKSYGYDRQAAGEAIDKFLQSGINPSNKQAIAEFTAARDKLLSGAQVGPRTYEVGIHADPKAFLNWDAPLNRQNPVVQEALQKVMRPAQWREFSPADVSTAMNQGFIGLDKRVASEKLAEAGLPGIRYLDQGSRMAVKNPWVATQRRDNPASVPPLTSNYVVFDPSRVEIYKKYGIVGAPMGALAAQDYYRMGE